MIVIGVSNIKLAKFLTKFDERKCEGLGMALEDKNKKRKRKRMNYLPKAGLQAFNIIKTKLVCIHIRMGSIRKKKSLRCKGHRRAD